MVLLNLLANPMSCSFGLLKGVCYSLLARYYGYLCFELNSVFLLAYDIINLSCDNKLLMFC